MARLPMTKKDEFVSEMLDLDLTEVFKKHNVHIALVAVVIAHDDDTAAANVSGFDRVGFTGKNKEDLCAIQDKLHTDFIAWVVSVGDTSVKQS